AAFALGRSSKRPVDRIEYRDREVEKVVNHDVVREVAVAQIQVKTKWRTRTVTTPGGTTTVYAEVERDEGKKASLTSDEAKSASAYRAREETHVTILAPMTKWTIQAHVGRSWALDSSFYGGSIARQLLGPFGLGIFANTRAAGLVIEGRF